MAQKYLGELERQAHSIHEFCARNGISLSTYYKLKGQGRTPREMSLGGVIRISIEAELAWRKERELPDDAEARLIKRERDARERASRKAARAAVASPDHVSKRLKARA